jgi:hypothetical protein
LNALHLGLSAPCLCPIPIRTLTGRRAKRVALVRDEDFERRAARATLQLPRLVVEALDRLISSSRPSFAFCTADFSTRMVSS